ncbi:MAG: hypothetical protein RL394_672, partial [Bacteroidota bacterium]
SVIVLLAFCIVQGCVKDQVMTRTTVYRPVYKTKEEVRANIKSSSPIELTAPGKLFYKDGYVFLNELNKGVHIIDVRNPSSPNNIAFVHVPGAVDLAVRGNILYADMYTDLVAIDITDPKTVQLKKVVPGVFPDRVYYSFVPDKQMIITEWIAVDTILRSDETISWGMMKSDVVLMSASSSSSAPGVSNGTGGSMARFALSDDRMYTVDYTKLKVFNTAIPENPVYLKELNTGSWDIETIFPFGKNLFLGSMTGMHIFDISSKDNPFRTGSFTHARVCDPVISDGKNAFVTLRNGSKCAGYINQLDVVDISDLSKPKLLKSYPMTNPHGLSKEGDVLIICEGADGVKFFNAADVNNIKQLAHVKGMHAFDVIALGRIAMVSAEDALYLIDFSVPSNPVVKGSVSIKN